MSRRKESFYEFFIRYCAPTLAGLKCANMMSCPASKACESALEQIRGEVGGRGVEIEVMERSGDRMLVLVYRPQLLGRILEKEEVRTFLGSFGYCDFSVDAALAKLRQRIGGGQGDFPHEVGVFLGYPLEDIRGFITNGGKNGLLCGEWKVYHEPEKARKTFANLEKCRSIYLSLFTAGTRTLTQLTVAA